MAAKRKGPAEVPVYTDRNKGSYAPYPYYATEMRPNEPIKVATLAVETFERGQSAARIWMHDVERDVLYPMFLSDFLELVKDMGFSGGNIENVTIIGTKKGQNYGVKLVEDEL